MTLRNYTSLLALVAAGVAAPAFAQETADSYTGPYVAVSGGYAFTDSSASDSIVFDTNRDGMYDNTVRTSTGANAFSPGFCKGSSAQNAQTTTPCNRDHAGAEYAVRVGYDADLGGFVGGVLIEGSKSDSTDSTTAFTTTPAGYSFTRGIDYAISARARLGISPMKGGLMYVTGGGSYARINHNFNSTNTVNSFTAVNDDKMVFGFQAGGGAEVKLARGLTLGMEYLYNRYNDDDYYLAIGNGTAGPTNAFVLAGGVNARPSQEKYAFHTVRAVLGFHF